ncbi:NAD(P)-dependent oxidoreductase [Salipiger abyssi]|uniref:NAD(P)-dependent oxidoreductase n=1 Tax=Salipiger abyssi TaxID=1250539 RepID=UPI001A901E03|nr:NAD(P)-dependent oxidoreductase [Salipiger abyssi]MBN9887901.1 glyoxylate reductase (NADP(+)) [Salipiger abyssi]
MTGPVIVNQIDEAFGAMLAAQPCKPRVINHFEKDRPWTFPAEAEVLVTAAFKAWPKAPDRAHRPALKWVQTYSAGIEAYPGWLLDGVIVTNGRGLTAPQIAEYVLAAMLVAERDIVGARATGPDDWGARSFGTLEGRVLGVLGYGAIGAETVARARAFGMEILVNRRGAWGRVPEGVTPCASPQEVVSRADHLLLAMPHTAETDRILDDALLAQAKPGLHLINVARGGLVDDAALLRALADGRMGRATLDVTAPEPLPEGHAFWTHPNILLTPHVSYIGGAERERFDRKTKANLEAFVSGAPMQDIVDLARGY